MICKCSSEGSCIREGIIVLDFVNVKEERVLVK